MTDMAKKQILPAVEKYIGDVAETAVKKAKIDPAITCGYEKDILTNLSALADSILSRAYDLDDVIARTKAIEDVTEQSYAIRDNVLLKMSELREACDEAETLTAEEYWPFPTYGDLLFGVR